MTVYPQEIHEAIQARRQEQREKDFQRVYAQRAGIEGTLSEGVRAHGMRRSRYRGNKKTHLQMMSVAAAINLVRIDQFLERDKEGMPLRRKRSPSPFARLQERMAV